MITTGTHHIHAKSAAILAVLSAPATLSRCIPKCETLTGSLADGYEFVLAHKLGPVTIRFRGDLRITETTPLARYDVGFTGHSAITGTLAGTIALALSARMQGTDIDYKVETDTSTLIKLLGSDRVDAVISVAVHHFFDQLQAQMVA